MANRGYDAVVDVDIEVSLQSPLVLFLPITDRFQGDLGHTDLQDDLEFVNSGNDTLP